MQLMKLKKGISMTEMIGFAIMLVVFAIVLGMGAKITDKMSGGMSGVAASAVDNGTAAIAELSSWTPTIALILAAIFIIGLILVLLNRFGGSQ